ncbi:hypothetical protein NADFUDRAFT_51314 [Nadsonia fulvescens var. elongata DSM 6958]|uniref:WW domain-containing protein n=1 Tax=Nadsonia fulvescens var. elongata DSM 6958 TaxID=857566 RepID=A0A1E3PM82_9ASCO|nr:hypothetical protein NADFUDRAFT_51314 [Nadsonia fulvescens var. elongata DSM 6958]
MSRNSRPSVATPSPQASPSRRSSQSSLSAQTSTTIPPRPPVPPGWLAEYSAEYNTYYYVNLYTGKSQWVFPEETSLARPGDRRSIGSGNSDGGHAGSPGVSSLATHPSPSTAYEVNDDNSDLACDIPPPSYDDSIHNINSRPLESARPPTLAPSERPAMPTARPSYHTTISPTTPMANSIPNFRPPPPLRNNLGTSNQRPPRQPLRSARLDYSRYAPAQPSYLQPQSAPSTSIVVLPPSRPRGFLAECDAAIGSLLSGGRSSRPAYYTNYRPNHPNNGAQELGYYGPRY